jgi:hypothetical protein
MSSWNVNGLCADKERLEKAAEHWKNTSDNRLYVSAVSTERPRSRGAVDPRQSHSGLGQTCAAKAGVCKIEAVVDGRGQVREEEVQSIEAGTSRRPADFARVSPDPESILLLYPTCEKRDLGGLLRNAADRGRAAESSEQRSVLAGAPASVPRR